MKHVRLSPGVFRVFRPLSGYFTVVGEEEAWQGPPPPPNHPHL
jgi:hypothetical protein